MILRFISFALTLLLLTPGSVLSAWAGDVGLSASERATNIKASNKRKAHGGDKEAPRARRGGAGPQREAMERARRCHEAVASAQQSANNIAMGSMALSQAASFIPFGGGMASGVAGAALGAGAMVAGEAARQKVADAANGC